jgi:hypothetical protein
VPGGKGLRLMPPRDQAGAAGLTVLGIEPAAPVPGQPVTMRFKSNLPSILSAAVQAPGAPAAGPVMAAQVTGTEERRLTLPAATQPGPYSVTLSADAGPGRTATLTVTPVVLDPNAPPPAAPDSGAGADSGPGLLGLPPEVKVIEGGLAQALIAAGPPADRAGERSSDGRRASRSSSLRPLGSLSSPVDPATSDHSGLGVLLASLCGFALWRFRSREPKSEEPKP